MSRKSSRNSNQRANTISSATVSKVSDRFVYESASRASHILRDRDSSKYSKSIAGSSMSQCNEVKKGGAVYLVRGIEADTTVTSSATSVYIVSEGATKYRKALSRLAKK
jgi:hypothetical protein